MYATPYLKIAEQLAQELNKTEVTDVHEKLNFIARFNNQFANEDQERVFPKPAILIQFSPTDWKTKGKGTQEGKCLVVIHIGMKSIADDNFFSDSIDEALNVDHYTDLVHKALQGFSAPCLGALNRVGSETDEDHTEIFVEKLTYSTLITDNIASTDADKEEHEVPIVVVAEKVAKVEQDSPFVVRTN